MKMTIWALAAAVAAGQGLFLSLFIFAKKENRFPNRIIAVLLLILVFVLLEKVLWWTGMIEQLSGLKGVGFGFPLLFGPLMFLFYQQLLNVTASEGR